MISKSFFQESRRSYFALGAVVFLTAIAAVSPSSFLIGAGAVVLACLFYMLPDTWKLFLFGLLFSFQDLHVTLPPFRGSVFLKFFPNGIDQSFVNIVGILLLLLIAYRIARSVFFRQKITWSAPLIFAAVLFWIAGFASVLNAEDGKLLSFKYVLFPIIFSYVAFVFVPATLANKRDLFFSLIRGMAWGGVISACIGALSFVTGEGIALHSAIPIGFFGVFPLGTNHNLLAEALVATIPLAILMTLHAYKENERIWWSLATVFMTVIALLTFARTAWIALAILAVVALFSENRAMLKKYWRESVMVLVVLVPLFVGFLSFVSSRVVEGSTASRLRMTDVAVFLFETHPLIGVGAGTYIDRLGQVQDFVQDFGDPLDAHGFGQKILSEEGLFGIVTFLFFLSRLLWISAKSVHGLSKNSHDRRTLLLVGLGALGMVIYELFNTTYYNAKMWLPLGLLFVALPLLTKKKVPVL